jgi:hypothetical protein
MAASGSRPWPSAHPALGYCYDIAFFTAERRHPGEALRQLSRQEPLQDLEHVLGPDSSNTVADRREGSTNGIGRHFFRHDIRQAPVSTPCAGSGTG